MKSKLLICFLASIMTILSTTNSIAGVWRQNTHGLMLTDKTTSDGYYVGSDGAWVSSDKAFAVAEYFKYQKRDDIYIEPNGSDYGTLYGNEEDFIDHGSYYELKNQVLEAAIQYDIPTDEGYEEWIQMPNGKWVIHYGSGYCDSYIIYQGSFYLSKDVEISYYDIDENTLYIDDSIKQTVTLEEYFNRSGTIMNTTEGSLVGIIMEEDENGYITRVLIQQAG